ncbi:MAG TPA: preprotein translocase subunit SecG [Candidatus Acidoferrum sp.]|nr:preprotein translocase subunit SecG [Candidatus Acidoferrum sp.]
MPSWMKWAIALAIGVGIIALGFRLSWGGTFILKPFFILNCLVLVIVVLLQSGKAADLAGAFGGAGSQTAFGPRGAANVLSKATTWCAVMFMLCAFAMTLRTDEGVRGGGSILQKVSQPAPKPAAPTTTPAQPNTHDSLPAGQQPATQTPTTTPQSSNPPATQTPAGQQPSQQAPAKSQPASQAPAAQPPASSQPAPAPTKKP